MDCLTLIHEIRKRPPLWNVNLKEHRDRDISRKLWEEIGEIIKKDPNELRKKWRYLRDNYRCKLKKRKSKANSPNIPTLPNQWTYFDDMKFLDKFMSPLKKYEKSTKLQDKDSNFELDDKLTDSDEVDTDERVNPSPQNSPIDESVFLELEKEKLKILSSYKDLRNDADYNFLMSFLPYLKKMSEIDNLRFRLKMSKLLLDSANSIDNSFEPNSISSSNCNIPSIYSNYNINYE